MPVRSAGSSVSPGVLAPVVASFPDFVFPSSVRGLVLIRSMRRNGWCHRFLHSLIFAHDPDCRPAPAEPRASVLARGRTPVMMPCWPNGSALAFSAKLYPIPAAAPSVLQDGPSIRAMALHRPNAVDCPHDPASNRNNEEEIRPCDDDARDQHVLAAAYANRILCKKRCPQRSAGHCGGGRDEHLARRLHRCSPAGRSLIHAGHGRQCSSLRTCDGCSLRADVNRHHGRDQARLRRSPAGAAWCDGDRILR